MHSRLDTKSLPAALLCLLLVIPQAAVIAQEVAPVAAGVSLERLERVDQMIERRIAAHDISGAVSLVARHGRIVHLEAHGLMDIEARKPMATDAIFWTASMTKPITTVAVLMLVEEGKLRLSDPVSRFIPQYEALDVTLENPCRTVPADRQITIHDLLTHTSGIATGIETSCNNQASQISPQSTDTLAEVVPRFAALPLDFQPGTRWAYSASVGFNILARIVEIASGQSFDRFLSERIFEPLGMKDTSFNIDETNRRRFAIHYRATPDGLEALPLRPPTAYFSGSGGLMSTAEDYFRFAQMLLQQGALDGERLLSPRTVELMRSIHVPDTFPGRQPGEGWGLGVRVITDAAARNTWLSNGSFGWTGAAGTHFWIDPKEDLVAILMIHTPAPEIRGDFETMVMQAILDD